jgi:hypothetical protein
MALATNKILLENAASNSAGAYFQAVTYTVLPSATTTIDAGVFMVVAGASNVTVEAAVSAGSYSTILASGVGGVIISDGTNVRFKNFVGTTGVPVVLEINEGAAASGTYA